uniref:Protein kinase domain-containing protein n=1 Tax=Oryzias latipes TaxID=8090 RepID=A0A3P9HH48_ORYLA
YCDDLQGRLLDYIVSWGNLTEEKVASYMLNVLQALHYLHNSRIAHLDVKPENLLVTHNASGQPVVKLADLGDAVQLNSAHYIHPLLGSPEFASPELVLGEPVSLTSDLWSLGVITYVLLSGASPFLDESAEETCLNICRLDFSFPREYFHGVSQAALDFVRLLLRTEPGRRPPVGLCLQEAWLQAGQRALFEATSLISSSLTVVSAELCFGTDSLLLASTPCRSYSLVIRRPTAHPFQFSF